MTIDRSAEMDSDEIITFLDRGGTGVISLATENVPYSTPISYGFDQNDRNFYFRLGFVDDSEKDRFIDSSSKARFVVYDKSDDTWQSVVAIGTLERIDADMLSTEVATNLRDVDLPLFDIWDAPQDTITFEIYRLVVEELTGRKAVSDPSM